MGLWRLKRCSIYCSWHSSAINQLKISEARKRRRQPLLPWRPRVISAAAAARLRETRIRSRLSSYASSTIRENKVSSTKCKRWPQLSKSAVLSAREPRSKISSNSTTLRICLESRAQVAENSRNRVISRIKMDRNHKKALQCLMSGSDRLICAMKCQLDQSLAASFSQKSVPATHTVSSCAGARVHCRLLPSIWLRTRSQFRSVNPNLKFNHWSPCVPAKKNRIKSRQWE